jgi:type VI secretion system protein ImpF
MPPPSLRRFTPSLLDRLLDDDPRRLNDDRVHEGQLLRDLKASVKRDLEDLLNARVPLAELPRGCRELYGSLLNYGLPDLQSEEVRGIKNNDELCALIEQCIKRFEPRLRDVRVHALDGKGARPFDRRFRFSIDAVLVAEPFREEVQFNSMVEPGSSAIRVEKVS